MKLTAHDFSPIAHLFSRILFYKSVHKYYQRDFFLSFSKGSSLNTRNEKGKIPFSLSIYACFFAIHSLKIQVARPSNNDIEPKCYKIQSVMPRNDMAVHTDLSWPCFFC